MKFLDEKHPDFFKKAFFGTCRPLEKMRRRLWGLHREIVSISPMFYKNKSLNAISHLFLVDSHY